MSDEIDRAQDHEQALRGDALAGAIIGIRIAAAMPGLAECCDCTDPIGAERLRAQPSARRCVTCQTVWETR